MAYQRSSAILWLKRIIGVALFLVLFPFTWMSIQIPLLGMWYDNQKKEVGETAGENFPVLVLTPAGDGTHEPWILVRPAKQARFWGPAFHVESREPGRQRIKVNARVKGEQDPIVGWYEATAESVTPLFHQSYNRTAVGIKALVIGFLANSAFWGVLIYARLDGRKKGQAKLARKEELRRAA